jgi:hypothetical protein
MATDKKGEHMVIRDPDMKIRGMLDILRAEETPPGEIQPNRTEMLRRVLEDRITQTAAKKSKKSAR